MPSPPQHIRPVITFNDMLTPYGRGLSTCRNGLLSGRSAIQERCEPAREDFTTSSGAVVSGLNGDGRSRVLEILTPLIERLKPAVSPDAGLLLATTTGEIDYVERAVLDQDDTGMDRANPVHLLETVGQQLGTEGLCRVISAACASSSVALASAADMIVSGRTDETVVVGADALSEFVYSGFSTLMALSPDRARPFDADRDGLTLGEAAAAAIIAHPDRARRRDGSHLCRLLGWGISSDANHMTGPSRDGSGLTTAMRAALERAEVDPSAIRAVCAHGTGTVYNDAMELKALRRIFTNGPIPVWSVKGGMGHTLGAAGLVECIISGDVISSGRVPPTVGLDNPEADARGWVRTNPTSVRPGGPVMTTNSGFGGVNCALVLGATE
ncbi:MAG: beta-ketoacyl synthase N-terminal-like domain-containing protein [Planctomycetota bacterium]